ncbi:aminoacyl-tRNA hydrolase [Microlunatus parietis]|uniref:Peptidyl-tRNA hydrolase n=1 Tax=Microlunatus parietis TaxID=682979 RepID=A0A7Y9I5R4_9ACTN|nr:aminoacyl-tRNA hydrolase [Microlunatus parietis]NYE70521.1 PTH1 family peptidyl-tRNA hydrolase [Microlunatus parietis]
MQPWLVVGLGNPGPTYAKHRHNVGHHVVDRLVERASAKLKAPFGMRAELAELRVGPPGGEAPRMVVAKSRTYMNETGGPVSKLIKYYKTSPAQLIVVHDELDIEPGQLRVKFGGGDNGHNGLKSIRASIGTGDFYRVRIGVGRPPGRQEPADYLLSNIPASQRADVEVEVERAADAIESLILVGLDRTQSSYNS